jgi:hypothetical protein
MQDTLFNAMRLPTAGVPGNQNERASTEIFQAVAVKERKNI